MKKIAALITTLICALQLVGCGTRPASEAKIDYGTSSLYTKEDMDEAIKLIEELFDNELDGCELHSLTYEGDSECNAENVAWLNDLEKARDNKERFKEYIAFKSDFRSPMIAYGAWEADKDYHWDFCLGRSEGGKWKLMTWGY